MTELAVPELNLATATLDELSVAATAEWQACESALVGAFARALRCGEILLVAYRHETMTKGAWEPWCERTGITREGASNLMRLATYRDHLPTEAFTPWTDARGRPAGEKDRRRRERERKLARRRARAALREKTQRDERDRLAKTTGGELAEAYSLIRRAIALLDKANRADAVRMAHKCEDAIVAALREERVER